MANVRSSILEYESDFRELDKTLNIHICCPLGLGLSYIANGIWGNINNWNSSIIDFKSQLFCALRSKPTQNPNSNGDDGERGNLNIIYHQHSKHLDYDTITKGLSVLETTPINKYRKQSFETKHLQQCDTMLLIYYVMLILCLYTYESDE